MAILDYMQDPTKKLDDSSPDVSAKPVTTSVDRETETVEGRLNNLTDGSSKYVNQARNNAARQANSRGLVNSTIAAGAGEEAAIASALPIASQDAETYTQTRFRNQDSQNEFNLNRQSADLGMERDTHASDLNKSEQSHLAGLETTRDENLARLAKEEQQFGSDLQIQRDNNAADLNRQMAELESNLKQSEMTLDADLRTEMERIINDEKYSHELRMTLVAQTNQIWSESQQQIAEIGLSDRTPEAQAAAIAMVEANRAAILSAYQRVLTELPNWEWSTFTRPYELGGIKPAP